MTISHALTQKVRKAAQNLAFEQHINAIDEADRLFITLKKDWIGLIEEATARCGGDAPCIINTFGNLPAYAFDIMTLDYMNFLKTENPDAYKEICAEYKIPFDKEFSVEDSDMLYEEILDLRIYGFFEELQSWKNLQTALEDYGVNVELVFFITGTGEDQAITNTFHLAFSLSSNDRKPLLAKIRSHTKDHGQYPAAFFSLN